MGKNVLLANQKLNLSCVNRVVNEVYTNFTDIQKEICKSMKKNKKLSSVVVGLDDAFSKGKDSSSTGSSQPQGLGHISEDVRDVFASTPHL